MAQALGTEARPVEAAGMEVKAQEAARVVLLTALAAAPAAAPVAPAVASVAPVTLPALAAALGAFQAREAIQTDPAPASRPVLI